MDTKKTSGVTGAGGGSLDQDAGRTNSEDSRYGARKITGAISAGAPSHPIKGIMTLVAAVMIFLLILCLLTIIVWVIV